MAPYDAAAMRNSFELVKGLLKEYDLLSLSTKLWNYMTQTGSMDYSALGLWIEQQIEFKMRFPAIEARRKAKLAPISPQEYVQYEREARQLMKASGIPASFYDAYRDFTGLISADVSLREVSERIQQGYDFVARATPEVKQAFAKFYGVGSDAAMAAYFLNPTIATEVILENTRKAQIAGAGAQMGLNLDLSTADLLADMGVDYQQALAGMAQVASLAPLFQETIGESQAHIEGGKTTRREFKRAVTAADYAGDFVPPMATTNAPGAATVTGTSPLGTGGLPKGKVNDGKPLLREGLRWDAETGMVVDFVEEYNDMTGENEGIAVAFNTSPAGKRRALRRLQARRAALGGGGGAYQTGTGSGIGSAEGRRRS